MSSEGRSRRREMVEEAYKLQVKAGLMASPTFLQFDPTGRRKCRPSLILFPLYP